MAYLKSECLTPIAPHFKKCYTAYLENSTQKDLCKDLCNNIYKGAYTTRATQLNITNNNHSI